MPYYSSTDDKISIFNVVGLVVVMTGGLIGGTFGVVLSTSSMGLTLGILCALFTSTVRKCPVVSYILCTHSILPESYSYPP